MATDAGKSPEAGKSPDAGKSPEGKQVVCHIEICGASGLPRAEQTVVRLSGFGIRPGGRCSLPLQEPSTEPSGWLFEDPEVEAARARAQTEAAAAPKAKARGRNPQPTAPPAELPPATPPDPFLRLMLPCGEATQRQRLLDQACSPLQVQLLRSPVRSLGTATLELQPLLHDTATLELDATLEWSPELIEELRADSASEAAKAAAEASKAAADGDEVEASEPEAQPFTPPPPGSLRVRVSTAAPIGRVLAPEDLHDWVVLTVQLHGCFSLPEAFNGAGGALPEGAAGIIAEHPLRYSLRLLGCSFDGGQLRVPAVEVPAEGTPLDASRSVSSRPLEEEEGAEEETMVPEQVPSFSFDVGMEEFVEGFLRAGYAAAKEDGPLLFDFLNQHRSRVGGRLTVGDFARLRQIDMPAEPARLRELCDFLRAEHGQLDEAFNALAEAAESLNMSDFKAGLQRLGYTGDDTDTLFVSLDRLSEGLITGDDLRTLGLHRRLEDFESINRVCGWLLEACGSVDMLAKQADERRTGTVTLSDWKSCMERLGCPFSTEAELLFDMLDVERTGSFHTHALESVTELNAATFTRALPGFQDFLMPSGMSSNEAVARLLGAAEGSETLTSAEFSAGCRRLGYNLKFAPYVFFTFLDEAKAGRIGASELSLLPRYNDSSKQRRLAACRSFVEDTFGLAEVAYGALFGDRSELFETAESSKPFIEWPEPVVAVYRGREWLQRLFNTLQDERGRRCAVTDEGACGGAWLHFFPRLAAQSELVDFRDVSDQGQAGLARMARWHHGQAFVDLRQLAESGASGPEFEFRAFLAQVRAQPPDVNESGDLSKAPFGAAQTYIKGSVRLDRPLARLCPRDILPLPELEGKPFVPPPPEKPSPPTVSEELELDAQRLVGKLACEFARMCHEGGLEEPQAGKVSKHSLLGRKGVGLHLFAEWLEEQDDGGLYRDLSAELRPAIVRFVRSEAKDGPACSLSGNENDARYSSIRDLILKHLFHALNEDVRANQRRQDACLWQSPPPQLAQQEEQDAALQRLVFEYECLGDFEQATELFQKRLALPQCAEDGAVWFSYSRFLMRCGQRQLEAEKALRFAMSLHQGDQGALLEEVVFLACMLQAHDLPSALDALEDSHRARFEAAVSVLEGYADKHPAERFPLYFLFMVHASEAWTLQTYVSASVYAAEGADVSATVAEEAAEQALLAAEASKYLELANASPQIFSGTLVSLDSEGQPTLPELDTLFRAEKRNRGDSVATTRCTAVPVAWEPPKQPVFASYESMHLMPDVADAAALECIDMMLHCGTQSLVRFLISNASYAYGFLSPATVASERCRLQLVRAAMLARDWDEAITLVQELFKSSSDRLPEAHALLGECHYRATRETSACPAAADFAPALAAFEAALSFIPESQPPKDPMIHLRVASIYRLQAEETSFANDLAATRALEHYKRSLLAAPTSEAWRSAGICALRRARLQPRSDKDGSRKALLHQALRYLSEANVLDRCQPQANAWLVICAVELGQVQVAKQAFRQVMRHCKRLVQKGLLELAEVLLRFSDEHLPDVLQEERGVLVLDGRYASEALAAARAALRSQEKSGEAHYAAGRAHALLGEGRAAVEEFCAALSCLDLHHPQREAAAVAARKCASQLRGEPQWEQRVEAAIRA